MRNRTRFILALSAVSALSCAANVADFTDWKDAAAPIAQAFGQDDDLDLDDEFDEEDDADDDSLEGENVADPFAPSKISENASTANVKKTTSEKAEAEKEEAPIDEEAAAKAKERANYLRPEDVPDDLKTEKDYLDTMTAPEQAILAHQPQNAAEWFSAAVKVARVGRANFAKLLVEKALQASDATPEQSAKILDELGVGRSVLLVANPEIGESGTEAYDKVFNVAKSYWEDEKTIRAAIEQFSQGSIAERASAVANVRKGGVVAIKTLVSDLMSSDEAASEIARKALPFMESDGVEALLAVLPHISGKELAAVVGALGDSNDERVGLELAARYYVDVDADARDAFVDALVKQDAALPSPTETTNELYQRALGFYARSAVFPLVVEDEVARWNWDEAKKELSQKNEGLEFAYRDEAARLANEALAVARKLDAVPFGVEELAIAATCERDLYVSGLDSSAQEAAQKFGAAFGDVSVQTLQSAIDYALDAKRPKGAIVPCVLLRNLGDESLCYARSNEQSTIVRAATSPDRRLRFEALTTIAAWNPSKPYIGASRVFDALQWFATSTGARVVVIASPKLEETSQIGAFFSQQGYKFISVTNGRDLLLTSQANADVEFAFATQPVSQPNARLIAQTLRGDVRTSDVPLFVGGGDERELTAANVAAGAEPNVYVAPTPFSLESASQTLQNLFDVVKPEQVPAQVRLQEAKLAARALLNFYQTRPKLYEFDSLNDTIARFLASTSTFDEGLNFAAVVKTNYAQNALVETIGDARFDIQTRRRALKAFEAQLQRNGSLLRGPEIKKMYDRYNASENESVENQQILSDMLDVFEKATQK